MSFTTGLSCPHGVDKCPCRHVKMSCSMFTAAEWGLVDQIERKLIVDASKADMSDSGGYTMLHYAAQHGRLPIVELLLRFGAQVDPRECGCTPLHRACFAGKLDCVKVLVQNGADLMARDVTAFGRGDTCLHKAARNGKMEIMEFLRSKKPELDTMVNNDGDSANDILNRVYSACCSSSEKEQAQEQRPTSASCNQEETGGPVQFGMCCHVCGERTLRMMKLSFCCDNLSCRNCHNQAMKMRRCKKCG